MTATTTNINDLSAAIESRNATEITEWYSEGATLTILDRDHPPASPARYSGRQEIFGYYQEICSRNIDHSVHDLVRTDDALAFVQHCRYPDGPVVVCVTVAQL